MRLLEYQGKELLQRFDVPVPKGKVVRSLAEVEGLPLFLPAMVKAQIPLGGRGKAGGVQRVARAAEVSQVVQSMLDTPLKSQKVEAVLIEEFVEIEREFYVALLVDRDCRVPVLLAHNQGGVEVESQANFWRRELPEGVTPQITRELLAYFKLPPRSKRHLEKLLGSLWRSFSEEDALLIEINPLALTRQSTLICADAKVELDGAAAFRHSDWPAGESGAQFVVLDNQGNIASMANGAGLAMATVDAIAASGARPANFLDVGGGTNTEGMLEALGKIAMLPEVKAVVINIFAGITRCDQVAHAIIAATQELSHLPPLFIRLAGTNEAEGQRLLAGAHIATFPSLAHCIAEAQKEIT